MILYKTGKIPAAGKRGRVFDAEHWLCYLCSVDTDSVSVHLEILQMATQNHKLCLPHALLVHIKRTLLRFLKFCPGIVSGLNKNADIDLNIPDYGC